jgi:glycine hydroxymethyltransferase
VREDTGTIDYAEVRRMALEHRPKMIVAGASAYPRTLDFETFADIARSVDAMLVVDMAHIAGLVCAGLHPSPVPVADVVTSTTHKTLRGPRGGLILSRSDYSEVLNKQIFPGIQGGPLMHVIAAKAVAFKEAMAESFKAYQSKVVENAATLAEQLMSAGISLVSDGTDNHMMLANLTNINITGKAAENLLGSAGITVNKNTVPGERRSPFVTSGVRIGTPALTTRGMGTDEMKTIATWIADVLKHPEDTALLERIRAEVRTLCQTFPLYPDPTGGNG